MHSPTVAGVSSVAVASYLGKRKRVSSPQAASSFSSPSVTGFGTPPSSGKSMSVTSVTTPSRHIVKVEHNWDQEKSPRDKLDEYACKDPAELDMTLKTTLPGQLEQCTKKMAMHRARAMAKEKEGEGIQQNIQKLANQLANEKIKLEDVTKDKQFHNDEADFYYQRVTDTNESIHVVEYLVWNRHEKAYTVWPISKIRLDMDMDVYVLNGVQSRLYNCGFEDRPGEDIEVAFSHVPVWKYQERLIDLLRVPDDPKVLHVPDDHKVDEQDDEAKLAELRRQIEALEAKVSSKKKARHA